MCAHARVLLSGLAAALAAAVGIVAPSTLSAAPLVVEESARITLPDTSYTTLTDVAIDGDSIIVGASKFVSSTGQPNFRMQAAFLFQRAGSGNWNFVRKLVELRDDDNRRLDISVAMDDGIAAVNLGNTASPLSYLRVFERTAAGWVSVPAQGTPDASDLEIDASTILASASACDWGAQAFRKGTDGVWRLVAEIHSPFRGCSPDNRGGDVDISGSSVIIDRPSSFDPDFHGAADVYDGPVGNWTGQTLTSPQAGDAFAGAVALENDTATVTGLPGVGTHVFRRISSIWQYETAILPPDNYTYGISIPFLLGRTMEIENGWLLQDRPGVIGVFRRDSNGVFQYLARLRDARKADMSGNRVVGIGQDRVVRVFELPTSFAQPASRQDTFNDGNSAGWAPQAGSSFTVATTPISRVYRQSSLAGNATSLLLDTDWTNQSIQADVRPTAFDGSDRWFGLAVRHTDAGNYYYVTARSSNVIQLRKIVNGTFQSLASATLPVTLNRSYGLRLEAIGTLLRVYVNGVQLLEARDSSLTHGQAGVIMFKTRADYDNVIVTPNPLTSLYSDDFELRIAPYWQRPAGSWSVTSEDGIHDVYQQISVAAGASSVIGVPTGDQIVEARALAIAFDGADRWFGIVSRYQDQQNYYYITVRNSNTLLLRKLVNGVPTTLDSAPMTVAANLWYTLRLEAIGSSLRAYVNDRPILEAEDTTFATGIYGLAMYKTAANFDDVRVFEP